MKPRHPSTPSRQASRRIKSFLCRHPFPRRTLSARIKPSLKGSKERRRKRRQYSNLKSLSFPIKTRSTIIVAAFSFILFYQVLNLDNIAKICIIIYRSTKTFVNKDLLWKPFCGCSTCCVISTKPQPLVSI